MSRIKEQFRSANDPGKETIPDEHLACALEAAAACPVEIISVEP